MLLLRSPITKGWLPVSLAMEFLGMLFKQANQLRDERIIVTGSEMNDCQNLLRSHI